MAKRFTDTNKWKDSWFQDLPIKYKLFWFYLLDECDNSGVWKPNIRLASFQIGEPFEEVEIKRIFGSRIMVTEKGYWFIKTFIDFQYGELSENCKPHIQVLNLLKQHKIKGYTKGIQTLKDKDKDKEEDKDKDKGWAEFKFLGDQSQPFISVIPKELYSQKYKVFGKSGLSELFQNLPGGGILNYPEHADKFMRQRSSKQFNSIMHVWNDYNNKFIPSIYK